MMPVPPMTTLGCLLKPYTLAHVAREIGRPRGFVWRLRHGQPLYDDAVIPQLAKVLRISEIALTKIIIDDRSVVRRARRAARQKDVAA